MAVNPDDWWGPEPVKAKASGRVVRLCTDDEEEQQQEPTKPQLTPFVAGDANGDLITAKGSVMPRGRPKGSKNKPRDAAALAQEAAPAARKGGRPKGARKATASNAARFARWDDGSLLIERSDERMTLTPGDAERLVKWLKAE